MPTLGFFGERAGWPSRLVGGERSLRESDRIGDALQTLRNLDHDVDLLFLDGRNDLYLQVLELIEPRLARRCLVVADLSHDDPDLAPYLAHVRDPEGRYVSICLPLDAGVEVSVLS